VKIGFKKSAFASFRHVPEFDHIERNVQGAGKTAAKMLAYFCPLMGRNNL